MTPPSKGAKQSHQQQQHQQQRKHDLPGKEFGYTDQSSPGDRPAGRKVQESRANSDVDVRRQRPQLQRPNPQRPANGNASSRSQPMKSQPPPQTDSTFRHLHGAAGESAPSRSLHQPQQQQRQRTASRPPPPPRETEDHRIAKRMEQHQRAAQPPTHERGRSIPRLRTTSDQPPAAQQRQRPRSNSKARHPTPTRQAPQPRATSNPRRSRSDSATPIRNGRVRLPGQQPLSSAARDIFDGVDESADPQLSKEQMEFRISKQAKKEQIKQQQRLELEHHARQKRNSTPQRKQSPVESSVKSAKTVRSRDDTVARANCKQQQQQQAPPIRQPRPKPESTVPRPPPPRKQTKGQRPAAQQPNERNTVPPPSRPAPHVDRKTPITSGAMNRQNIRQDPNLQQKQVRPVRIRKHGDTHLHGGRRTWDYSARRIWALLILGLGLVCAGIAMTLIRHKFRDVKLKQSQTDEENDEPSSPPFSDEAPTLESSPRQTQIDLIIRRASSNEYVFESTSTPQSKAMNWMLHQDDLDYVTTVGKILQRYALATFYFATSEDETWMSNNWLYGDECASETWFGINCNDANQVRAIALDDFGLSGSIPNEISLLSVLENLIVKNNEDLEGVIPASLGEMVTLKQIGLYNNNLSGTIPDTMSRAFNLNYLNLENNQLSGTIPQSFDDLRNLETLVLSNNSLEGAIPMQALTKTKLRHLSLSHNRLSSMLDSVDAFESLEYLLLDNNQLIGTIPSEIGLWTTLRIMDMSSNQLGGPIPSQIGRLRRLESLALQNNQFAGTVSREVGLLVSLIDLNLSSNGFTGTIPNISNLAQLKNLYLFENSFTGTFPESIQQLPSVEIIFLSSNNLSGAIPYGITRLRFSLRGLYLSDNDFYGRIPAALCDFYALEALFLDTNSIGGTVPSCLGELPQLRQLYLFQNELIGQIPTDFGKLENLQGLGLEANDFDGKVPDGICARADGNNLDLWADCNSQEDGGNSIDCACCSVCCPGSECT